MITKIYTNDKFYWNEKEKRNIINTETNRRNTNNN